MENFHPVLRRALLKDKEHKKRGLTPKLLISYEGLVTQLFYLVHYPARPGNNNGSGEPVDIKAAKRKKIESQQQQEDLELILRENIREFRATFLPNFDSIHRKFVAKQKRAILGSHYDLVPESIKKIVDFFKPKEKVRQPVDRNKPDGSAKPARTKKQKKNKSDRNENKK